MRKFVSGPRQALDDTYHKALRTVESCLTPAQVQAALRFIDNGRKCGFLDRDQHQGLTAYARIQGVLIAPPAELRA